MLSALQGRTGKAVIQFFHAGIDVGRAGLCQRFARKAARADRYGFDIRSQCGLDIVRGIADCESVAGSRGKDLSQRSSEDVARRLGIFYIVFGHRSRKQRVYLQELGVMVDHNF